MTKYYLAVDIGASSGRHIVGWREGGELKTQEVYRFPNGVTEQDGHLTWDIDALLAHVKAGIEKAREKYEITSLSIDTWGVDYVLLKGDETVCPVYAYRDRRTESAIPAVHEKIPFVELYRRTGIQFQPFNTIYQLFADQLAGRLTEVTDFLMIPEYLMYRLCGVKSHEYTNATTGGMVSAETGAFDPAIVQALGLPEHLFRKLQQPGTVIGEYEGIKVLLCATQRPGPPTGPTRAAWATTGIRRTSWACGSPIGSGPSCARTSPGARSWPRRKRAVLPRPWTPTPPSSWPRRA